MELARIERYVGDLLECSAVGRDGAEATVYEALFRLLTAVSLYEQMSAEEKAFFTAMKKKLQYFFSASFNVKERKETKKKKNFPPNPLIKEKAKKETAEQNTEQNTAAGDAVLEGFRKECLRYVEQYGQELVTDFYYHWKQVDKKTGKRLFEEKRCFDVDSQLRAWSKSEFTLSKESAAMRKQQAEKKLAKQQNVVQERNEANDRLWQQYDDMKKGAVTHEDWLAMKQKQVGPQGASKSNKI